MVKDLTSANPSRKCGMLLGGPLFQRTKSSTSLLEGDFLGRIGKGVALMIRARMLARGAGHRRHDHRPVLVEELLPRFLLAAFDRDFDTAADGEAGGSTATASISRSAPSRANPEMAMVVLAGRLRSGK
jgi:hypothetical protein